MPKINYLPGRRFTASTLAVIDTANGILEEYAAQGYTLTLRQLYYQFVARGFLENTDRSYDRLGSIINDARMAGLVDWHHLVDRTRNLKLLTHFEDAQDGLNRLVDWWHIDMWEHQPVRPEVWIEKDALVGVIERVCNELDVPYFSCRGYTSQSSMWRAGQRLGRWHRGGCDCRFGHATPEEARACATHRPGQHTHIIHLGDHDPSGMDMSRDIFDRLETFMGGTDFERIALNMDQVEEHNPPPNPAKLSDSRCAAYVEEFGYESWELDALDPKTLTGLIRDAVERIRDEDQYAKDLERKEAVREQIVRLRDQWDAVNEGLDADG